MSFHTAVHLFDALRFITGREVVRVMARTGRQRNRNLEDILLVLVEMEEALLGVLDCSKVGHARSGRLEFVGDKGQIWADQVHGVFKRVRGMEIEDLDPGPAGPTIPGLLNDWQAYLSGRAANPVRVDEGVKAVAACEACLRSARLGEWTEVPLA